MLDEVLFNLRMHGRIVSSGMISQYNLELHEELHYMIQVIVKCIHMIGFVVYRHYHLYPKFLKLMRQYMIEGKVVYVEDVVEGIQSSTWYMREGSKTTLILSFFFLVWVSKAFIPTNSIIYSHNFKVIISFYRV
ncbi:hypothetical protein Scep_020003 [Stephania cephalantha]|uniref:Uncharacterized protein n=1 Tax=Stephania cephalantha TaxID=152367 RepID=A0AAP0IBW1_9MAGN